MYRIIVKCESEAGGYVRTLLCVMHVQVKGHEHAKERRSVYTEAEKVHVRVRDECF